MLTRETMRGLYALTITPFDPRGELDEEAYRENVRCLLAHGVDGIITCGTNGEFHTSTDEERKRIARLVVEETRGRAVAIAGASGVNTAESIASTPDAVEASKDAVMNLIPLLHVLSNYMSYQKVKRTNTSRTSPGLVPTSESLFITMRNG